TIDPNRSAVDWTALAKLYATARQVAIKGESYSNLSVCLNRSDADDDKLCRRTTIADEVLQQCAGAKKGGACLVATAHRDRGGSFDATIANLPPRRAGMGVAGSQLGGVIKLSDVPMAVLEPFVGPDTVGGLFSATLFLEGK